MNNTLKDMMNLFDHKDMEVLFHINGIGGFRRYDKEVEDKLDIKLEIKDVKIDGAGKGLLDIIFDQVDDFVAYQTIGDVIRMWPEYIIPMIQVTLVNNDGLFTNNYSSFANHWLKYNANLCMTKLSDLIIPPHIYSDKQHPIHIYFNNRTKII